MANNFSDKTNKSIAELAAQIMNDTPATVRRTEPREAISSDMVDRVLAVGPSGRFKKIQEEVEQVDEVNSRHSFTSAQAALTPKSSDVKAAVGATARDKAQTNKYARRISKITGGEYSKQDVKDNLKSLTNEEAEKIDEVKDKGEYDYEGDMAMSQLKSIIKNAQKLHDMIEEDTNLPEWVQSKITLAEDYIVTVTNYLDNELSEENNIIEAELKDRDPNRGIHFDVYDKRKNLLGNIKGHGNKWTSYHHDFDSWEHHTNPEDAIKAVHKSQDWKWRGQIAKDPSWASDPSPSIADFHAGRHMQYDSTVKETAPEGWEGTVKAMKGKKGIDNPWALAWWMKKRGFKSHKGIKKGSK